MRRVTGQQIEMVRSVLNDWDPIGVADSVSDEYDSYIAGFATLLLETRTQHEIAKHLYKLETVSMGMRGDRDRYDEAAQALLRLDMPLDEY